MGSIRKRLLVALLAAVAVAGIAGSWLIYRNALVEADSFFDDELRQIAMSLRDQDFGYAVPEALREARVQYDFVVQVWTAEGRRIYLSQPHPTLPGLGRLGYSSTPTAEGTWRTFTVRMRGQVIQVAQPEKVRSRLATSLAFRTLSPFFLVIPMLGIAASLITAWGLRPLEDLTRAIGKRDPQALAPLPAEGHPAEIQPLVASLNTLLERLGAALDAQRSFVADAAHELRTPLTALKLQLQLAQRATTDVDREAAFERLAAGIQRSTRLVEQLLTLARQEPEAMQGRFAPLDLTELARSVLTDLHGVAALKELDLGLAAPAPVPLQGDVDGLRILLANLVDNAIHHTPSGGMIDVAVDRDDTGAPRLRVTDTGPGIHPDDRERVFRRFYRAPGTVAEGSGLGLAIVKRIADLHRAQVTLGDNPAGSGLAVTVSFPPEAGEA